MSEENKAIVRRFFDELWNTRTPDAVDDLIDAKCDGDICYLRPGALCPPPRRLSLLLIPPYMPTVFLRGFGR